MPIKFFDAYDKMLLNFALDSYITVISNSGLEDDTKKRTITRVEKLKVKLKLNDGNAVDKKIR